MPMPNTGTGQLTVAVRTAGGALPIEGALVTVSSEGEVIGVFPSDRSGNTELLAIPTPPREASQKPGYDGLPYATVFIEVDKDGYYSGQYISVPVFPDVITRQPVNLLPLPEFYAGDTDEGTQYFDEGEGYAL